MSQHPDDDDPGPSRFHGRKVTTNRLKEMKRAGVPIAALTAYDVTMAQLLDAAGVDLILVGEPVVYNIEDTDDAEDTPDEDADGDATILHVAEYHHRDETPTEDDDTASNPAEGVSETVEDEDSPPARPRAPTSAPPGANARRGSAWAGSAPAP